MTGKGMMKSFLVGCLAILTLPIWAIPAVIWVIGDIILYCSGKRRS